MKIAVNPETGEQIVLQGGKWVPLQVAENPETGERLGLVDNRRPLRQRQSDRIRARMAL